MLRKSTLYTLLLILILSGSCKQKDMYTPANKRILVFTKTVGFHHSSIPDGEKAIVKLGSEHGFQVDTTIQSSMFNDETLKLYDAVVFLHTTGDVLNALQEKAFQQYIQAGNGFVGIHSATDTEYDWPWYNQLVGAYFSSHPKIQKANIEVRNQQHESTAHLGSEWTRTDEWYNFKSIISGPKVLLNLDESSYEGGKNGKEHPISWYRDFDGGRSWYTGLGHTSESFIEPEFLSHILGGIQYAMGDKKDKSVVIDQSRFSVEPEIVRSSP